MAGGTICSNLDGEMDNKDFIRTENKKISYKKQSVMWSCALLSKTRELAQYLVRKRGINNDIVLNYEYSKDVFF